jgi:demethylmenaquinone methyltransferase/2-methoxy-6-polyprenyl-1,4-benzoquinol methylase
MFGRIAGRYDLMNRLMTLGQDRVWRAAVLAAAELPATGRLLDIGAGTGDLALAARRRRPGLQIVAADFTLAMIRVGGRRPQGASLQWCAADALRLPFADGAFDASVCAYLVRNVDSPRQAFREQLRVTRPGGRVVCLETAPPPPGPLRPLVYGYLNRVIPLLGVLIAGDRRAYSYLSASTRAFAPCEDLARLMRSSGLTDVRYRRFMFGTISVVKARCPG